MSESTSEYDPMSLHPGVDEIYSSPQMIEHARLMRSISQAATRRGYIRRSVESIHRPDLFGGPGWAGVKPPVSPEILNDNPTTEDVFPGVDHD